MKTIYPYFFCIVTFQLFIAATSNAQFVNRDPSVLKPPVINITTDGDLKDWGDSLQYYNAENNVRYGLSNDKENLYFAVRIDEPTEAVRILKAGITLGIDPKGKKKSAYAITFPVNTQEISSLKAAPQDNMGEITQADRDELHRELITSLRGIKVEGFKDIEGDMITTANTYGIKTAIDYDAKGNLICEAAIPLKFFHLDEHSKAEWAFDIKINGITRLGENKIAGENNAGGMGGGRGGRGGGGMGGGRGGRGGGGNRQAAAGANTDTSVLTKSFDFSGKFYLANQQ